MTGDLVPLPGPLARLESARAQLEATRDLADVKQIRDVAVAAAAYAKARKLGADAVSYAQEIVNRAERRIGQLLAEAPKATPGPKPELGTAPEPNSSPRAQAGKKLSARAQTLAALPDDVFEAHVHQSAASLEWMGRAARAAEQRQQPAPPLDSLGRFPVLLADPPWAYDEPGFQHQARIITAHYPVMGLDEIKALPVPAADDAVLFLWTTSPKLLDAGAVMEAWGFTYRSHLVWVKDKAGMGWYARNRHELLLIGKRGRMRAPLTPWPDSVITAPRREHSTKPDAVYEVIEWLYPGESYCELFQRRPRPGWHGWGNEPGLDAGAVSAS